MGPWPCLWTNVFESSGEVTVGQACAPEAWRAGGQSSKVSDAQSRGRISMELSVSISTRGPDPGELMTETPGLGTWGCSHLLPGLPTISSSPSLSYTERSSCSDPDSLEEAAAQLSPHGRGVFRSVHVQFPLKVLCTEVTFRVPSLCTGECECEICPTLMATAWMGPQDPGGPPMSVGEESVWFVLKGGRAGVPITMAEMRWPAGDGAASFHDRRPEGGEGVSMAAPWGTVEEGNLAWMQIWKSSYEGKKWMFLIQVGWFYL